MALLLLPLPPKAVVVLPLLPDDDDVDCLVAALGVDRLDRADDGGGDNVSMAPPPLSSLLLSSAAPLLPTAGPVDLRPRFDFGRYCLVNYWAICKYFCRVIHSVRDKQDH